MELGNRGIKGLNLVVFIKTFKDKFNEKHNVWILFSLLSRGCMTALYWLMDAQVDVDVSVMWQYRMEDTWQEDLAFSGGLAGC